MHNNFNWFIYFVAVNYTACTHSECTARKKPEFFAVFPKYFTKYFMPKNFTKFYITIQMC